MRKRNREKIAKAIYDIVADLDHLVLQQLNGSAWYFEQNSEYKGFDFGYASQRNLVFLANQLKLLLDTAAKNMDKEDGRKR